MLLIITKLYLSYKFRIHCFLIISNTIVFCRQVHLQPPKSFNRQDKAKIERRGSIRAAPIIVMEIFNLIWILWIQWFLGNTLLSPTSVSKFPGPAIDVFSIAIVDPISRSALVGFSILHGRYYCYLMGLMWNVYYGHNL